MESKTYIGYRPYEHQKFVHNLLNDAKGKGNIIVIKSHRQCGKSLLIENELLRQSINYNNVTNICLSPTLNQSRKIFKDLVKAISNTPIYKSSNATTLDISLRNGSQILLKSAEQKEALRGYTCDVLLCIDECAYIDDDIFYSVLQWTSVHKANILMTSTPKFRNGFFYKYYQLGIEKSNPNIISVDFNEYDTSALLSEEQKKLYQSIFPKAQFKSEVLGEFLDDDSMVFQNLINVLRSNEIKPTDKLYWGIDWSNGNGGDFSVLTAFNQDRKQVYMKRFNNLSPNQQIEHIKAILEPYMNNTKIIQCETNSIGTPLIDMLKSAMSKHSNKIVGFTTTNDSKNKLVTRMQIAIEKGDIELLDNEHLANEFKSYQLEFNTKTKSITYNAPTGLHDDIVMATMIAYNGLETNSSTGSYNLYLR